jgi:uncharacterized repeat protein (TIGR01451 family)
MRRALTAIAAGILCAGLTGCSGGGGGGGGSGGSVGGGDTPLTYNGVNTAANLSTTNAGSITANVVGSGDVSQAVSLAGVAPESGTVDVGRVVQRSVRALTKPRNGKLTSAIPFDDNFDCDSGSAHVFGTLNDNGTGTLQVQYNACRTGDVTASGSGSVRVDAFDFQLDIPSDFTVSFIRLTLDGSVVGEVSGSVQTRLDRATTISITTTENLVARFSSGTMTKSENLTYVDVFGVGINETVSGRVFHSAHGFVDINTTVPFHFDNFSQEFPSTGQLVLTGANRAAIRLTALSTKLLSLGLDLNGDGVLDRTVMLAWSDLGGPVGADLGDDDGDNIHNSYEVAKGLDPNNGSDALADPDGDGATNIAEYEAGTDPKSKDSTPRAVGLSISAGNMPPLANSGGVVTYTYTISSVGGIAANKVVLTDVLPAGVTLQSVSAGPGSCTATTPLTCNFGTLDGNTFSLLVTIVVMVAPTVQGVITNTVTVSTTSFDANLSDNRIATVTTVGLPIEGLQAKIDTALTGDTILVDAGLYVGELNFHGKDVVLRGKDGPATTILHGGKGTAVRIGPGGQISGFTITGTSGALSPALTVSGTGSLISGNVFDGNQVLGGGASAIDGFVASSTIERNIFRNNSCDNQFASGVIVFTGTASPRVANNVFQNNACRALNFQTDRNLGLEVVNNTFFGNRAGIRIDGFADTSKIYRNNILVQNDKGVEMDSLLATIPATWTNNLVFGSTTSDYPSFLQNPTGADGNLSVDPSFVDAAAGNFHLRTDSPAINKGSLLNAPTVDFDGVIRQGDIDIGAFEVP